MRAALADRLRCPVCKAGRSFDLAEGESDGAELRTGAAATFARHGLDVTALDISTHVMQGLCTADWQMEDKGVYFERVLAMMFDLPFADGSASGRAKSCTTTTAPTSPARCASAIACSGPAAN